LIAIKNVMCVSSSQLYHDQIPILTKGEFAMFLSTDISGKHPSERVPYRNRVSILQNLPLVRKGENGCLRIINEDNEYNVRDKASDLKG